MTNHAKVQERRTVERRRVGGGDRRRAPVPGGPELEIVIGAACGRPLGVLEMTVPVGGAMPERAHGASEAGEVERVLALIRGEPDPMPLPPAPAPLCRRLRAVHRPHPRRHAVA